MLRWLVALLLLFVCSAAVAMGVRRPMQAERQAYYFDGNAFQAGKAAEGATVYLKEGYLPLFQDLGGKETKLPLGMGAIAGLCYIQTAGGKLKQNDAYILLQNIPIEIIGRGVQQTLRTTPDGFFMSVLPPGAYEVRLPGIMHKVSVESGKTSLLAVRGGKRMVD